MNTKIDKITRSTVNVPTIPRNGVKCWYRNGLLHRLNGPAIEQWEGSKWWYINGLLHRSDGPAVDKIDGHKEWWLNGVRYTEEEFLNKTKVKMNPTIDSKGNKEWYSAYTGHKEDEGKVSECVPAVTGTYSHSVFVCSPYRGDVERNVDLAKKVAKLLISKNINPLVPHLYYTQILDDNIVQEREAGMALGLETLDSCDDMLVITNYGISSGMALEIAHAQKSCIPITYCQYSALGLVLDIDKWILDK